jgi:hypothetical protein
MSFSSSLYRDTRSGLGGRSKYFVLVRRALVRVVLKGEVCAVLSERGQVGGGGMGCGVDSGVGEVVSL